MEKDQIFTYKNNEYGILCDVYKNSLKYYFAVRLENDEVTNEYYLFEENDNDLKIVTDKKLFESMLPILKEKVDKELFLLMKGESENE